MSRELTPAATATTPAARRPLAVRVAVAVAACLGALLLSVAGASSASAHVLPWSSVALAVGESSIDATVSIPLDDLEAASGIELADQTQEAVDADEDEIVAYLESHFAPTSDDGEAWTVSTGELVVTQVEATAATAAHAELTVVVTLTPPDGASLRSFDLGYDVVVREEITHIIYVTVASDFAGGTVDGGYQLGAIRIDTATGEVGSEHVDLGAGSEWSGLSSMFSLGMSHIAEGTDHQLFLLTLLLPAPLLAAGRRWTGAVTARRAVRRIGATTIAFTIGHSVTLALGALGVPVWVQLVESMIAVSILVAAVHAVRPIFPGKEALVAGVFGLVHGLAFSETLQELDLSGSRLVLSLLGFNLGIEAMQLVIVALVLPPLVVLARLGRYRRLRVVAASLTAVAALGWLAARLGLDNPVADVADGLGVIAPYAVAALWIAAIAFLVRERRRARSDARSGEAAESPAESRLAVP